jgi:hypothetical protein
MHEVRNFNPKLYECPPHQTEDMNGYKNLMKRPRWLILSIHSGVPELMDFVNAKRQLTSLLEPVTYHDIAYDGISFTKVDTILVKFNEAVGDDPTKVRS